MNSNTLSRFSTILSYALHPFLLPTIMVIALMFGNSIMSVIPTSLKLYFIGMIALGTFILPVLMILLLRVFKIIPSTNFDNSKDRIIPMFIVAICYIACYISLKQIGLSYLLNKFILAAFLCVMAAFVINFFWKISLHMIGMGGIVAILIVLNSTGYAKFPVTIAIFIILAGLVGSARLYLGRHDAAQVVAGFAVGFTVAAATVLFLK